MHDDPSDNIVNKLELQKFDKKIWILQQSKCGSQQLAGMLTSFSFIIMRLGAG